ncbi:hypothetical protein C8Q77DRAFT_411614 [Trametes polyzona]|nr:hypothetical protein C8Q77DRAFT_411614 [Trametes polyzona]
MKVFVAFIAICLVVAEGFAFGSAVREPICAGAKAVSNSTISVDGKVIAVTTFSCDIRTTATVPVAEHGPVPALSVTGPNPAASSCAPLPAVNLCGATCNVVCDGSDQGGPGLPPTPADCATVVNSAATLSESISQTFNVAAGHVQLLTFGTCSFFFFNGLSSTATNCWLTFAQTAKDTKSTCLPPVNTGGSCFASDGSGWSIGVMPAP